MRISDWSSDVCSSDLLQGSDDTQEYSWLGYIFAAATACLNALYGTLYSRHIRVRYNSGPDKAFLILGMHDHTILLTDLIVSQTISPRNLVDTKRFTPKEIGRAHV